MRSRWKIKHSGIKIDKYVTKTRPKKCAYFKLATVFKFMEIRLEVERFLEFLQELALERHDLLDVAEQRVDLGVGEEGLLLEGLQVVLEQIVQMLRD